jgi:hypothetical protein
MLAPMPTAARSSAEIRPAIMVSITPPPITAICATSVGQARCNSARGKGRGAGEWEASVMENLSGKNQRLAPGIYRRPRWRRAAMAASV